jgi:hypothetical protein
MQNTASMTPTRAVSTTVKNSQLNLLTRLKRHNVSKAYDERSVNNSGSSILGGFEMSDTEKTSLRRSPFHIAST